MKKWMAMSAVLVAALGLGACKAKIDGQLTVDQSFDLNLKRKGRTYTVPAGQHEVTIALKKKRRGNHYAELQIKNEKGRTQKAQFQFPEGSEIPKEGGSFSVAAADSGQNVDLEGNIDFERTDSEEREGWEGCWYDDWERYCEIDAHGNRRCYNRRVSRRGERRVRYFVRTEDRHLTSAVSQGGEVIASFDGERSDSWRVYTYEGYCGR